MTAAMSRGKEGDAIPSFDVWDDDFQIEEPKQAHLDHLACWVSFLLNVSSFRFPSFRFTSSFQGVLRVSRPSVLPQFLSNVFYIKDTATDTS